MMLEFTGLVVLLALVGVGLYVYADRYKGLEEQDPATK
jgi:hypothetical protein